jgi:hypothetical protein
VRARSVDGDADELALFDVPGGQQPQYAGKISDQRLLENLRSFVAPIANDASAVVDDPRALQMARDLSEVFAEHAGVSGLTKAEAEHALARRGLLDRALFESRFDLFVRMGLIQPFLAKKHQSRYVLDPCGLAGLLVFERMGTRGGVDEMLLLLDRTRWMVERGEGDRETVAVYLRRCRHILTAYAAALARLVESASIRDLIDEQRHHDPHRVEAEVHALNKLVTDRYPRDHKLGDLAFQLVEAELGYREQVLAAVERVLDQGGASLDFSVLTAEQYLTAAVDASAAELAEVGRHLVVDPPMPWVDPGAVLEAVEEYRPRRKVRIRPPSPADAGEGDPIGAMERRHDQERRRRTLAAESQLQGLEAVELTGVLRGMEWPAASQHLVNLLAVSGDPAQPFRVELGQSLLIDPETPVTYLHPVTLHRAGQPSAASGVLESANGNEMTSEALPPEPEVVHVGLAAMVGPEGAGR